MTSKKDLDHSYSLATLDKNAWDLSKLAQFLTDVGSDENSNWSVLGSDSSVYTHNVCKGLAKASPIQCPDRMRIAAEEPRNVQEILAFLKFARKLPVVVKVKTPSADTAPYYPPKDGTVREFGEGDNKIVVECVFFLKHEQHPITRRTLKIGADIVHHIQVDWKNGFGLDVNILSALIQMVADLEDAHPGETLVHCTLGLGRTGTFVACQIIKALIESVTDIQELKGLSLNLEELLRTLRQKRSCMIQHEDQLFTILEYTAKVVRERFMQLG